MKQNNKGFSFIELIVVVAILVVATSVTVGSISTVFHARSTKAVKTVVGLVNQSKVNAMSGRDNYMVIEYDSNTKDYICSLTDIYSGKTYATEHFGNNDLEMSVSGVPVNIKDNKFILSFNMDTGKIKTCSLIGDAVTDFLTTSSNCVVITFRYYQTHTITIYKNTGSVEVA